MSVLSEAIIQEVLEALEMNREIEFSYKGNSYALVYHQEGWALVNRELRLSEYYARNSDMLEKVRLDGKPILDLMREGEIKVEMIL